MGGDACGGSAGGLRVLIFFRLRREQTLNENRGRMEDTEQIRGEILMNFSPQPALTHRTCGTVGGLPFCLYFH